MGKWNIADKELQRLNNQATDFSDKYLKHEHHLQISLDSCGITGVLLVVLKKGVDYPKTFILNKEQALFLKDYLNDLFQQEGGD